MSDKWTTPTNPDDIDFVSPMDALMPAYEDIPDEFKRQDNPWVKLQQKWFFHGLAEIPTAKPGIDLSVAMEHLSTIQRSWEPKHQHKEAAVAYLASLWFEEPKPDRRKRWALKT